MGEKIAKFINRIDLKTLETFFLILIILASSIIAFFYWFSAQQTEASLVEQMLHREQVIARAGAKAIEGYFFNVKNELKLLAQSQQIVVMGKEMRGELDSYIADQRETPVTGVSVTNSEGVVIANANNLDLPTEIGISVADRAYFRWARNAKMGEVYLSAPVVAKLGATKGQTIIPLASPIVEKGKFKGVTVTVVLLPKLTELYLNPLKISEQTGVYLVNSDGVLFYAPYERLVGVNYFDYLKSKPYKDSEEVLAKLKRSVESKEQEGKLDILLPNEQKEGVPTRFLIAYSPLKLGSTNLVLVVANPVEEAMIFAGPLYTNQTQGVIFGLTAVLIVLIWFVVSIRIVQRQSFLEGFAQGQDHQP